MGEAEVEKSLNKVRGSKDDEVCYRLSEESINNNKKQCKMLLKEDRELIHWLAM